MASWDEMFLAGPTDTSFPLANVVFLMQENTLKPRNLKFRKRPGGLYMSPLSLLVSLWPSSSRVSGGCCGVCRGRSGLITL